MAPLAPAAIAVTSATQLEYGVPRPVAAHTVEYAAQKSAGAWETQTPPPAYEACGQCVRGIVIAATDR